MHLAFRRRARRINVSGENGCERNRVFRVRWLYRSIPGSVVRLLQVCSEHGILAHACVTNKQSHKISFTILAAEEGGTRKEKEPSEEEGGRPTFSRNNADRCAVFDSIHTVKLARLEILDILGSLCRSAVLCCLRVYAGAWLKSGRSAAGNARKRAWVRPGRVLSVCMCAYVSRYVMCGERKRKRMRGEKKERWGT